MDFIEITQLDFVLVMIIGYGLGVVTGLCYCVKSTTFNPKGPIGGNLTERNHQKGVIQPNWDSPVLASAPPAHNPVKLTIE